MARVALIYFNAGGGHRAAAQALHTLIGQQGRPWQVERTNLVEVLDPQGRFERLTGLAPEDLYNKRLARGWTLGMTQELKLLQGMIRLAHASLARPLVAHWRHSRPDLVVSLVPNFNRVLYDSLCEAAPGTPFLTVMTDIADLPPNFWIEPGQDQHIVCGSDQALAQARAAGYADQRLTRASGMVLRPDFYAPAPTPPERAARRRALGLPATEPVGAVMFGGQGTRVMVDIAQALQDRPLILMCGHNARLAERLRRLPASAPRLVLGFTPEVPRWLRLADYFIGKPGPGALSEAVHCGLPVVTVRNAFTMPQERANTDWLLAQGLGLVLPGFRHVAAGVQALLDDLPRYRDRVAAVDNRAVFEVVDLMARLLQPATAGAATPDQNRCGTNIASGTGWRS